MTYEVVVAGRRVGKPHRSLNAALEAAERVAHSRRALVEVWGYDGDEEELVEQVRGDVGGWSAVFENPRGRT